jgi:hypothetical protein
MGVAGIAENPRQGRLGLALFGAAAVLVPLLYAFYTGHIWEDYFITFKHSQNLCEGHGLVFYPGERVHGFTSPLGTLLPALCYAATGMTSYLPALWLFRTLSALAFAGAGLLFLRALRDGGAALYGLLAFAVLYLLDVKAIDFSINGMESAFMLLFFAWGFALVVKDDPRSWPALGLSWAGLMWTRPDGCVYVATLGLATLVFGARPRGPRLVALLKAAAVCTVVYLPWFLWAWSYYGSPVPNTIRAKANYGSGYEDLSQAVLLTLQRFPERTAEALRPTHFGMGGWPPVLGWLTQGLGLFCAAYWLVPSGDRFGRRASFCFALLSLYLSFLTIMFPWYLVPVGVCGLLVVTGASAYWAGRLAPRHVLPRCLILAAIYLLTFVSLSTLALGAYEMKVQQKEIEWGNRAAIGGWLKEHVGEGERVYIECLGYAGYFSGVKILDYPGLVSPEVLQAARQAPRDFASIGMRLKPEWMVLRPAEVTAMSRNPEFAALYKEVQVFDATERVNSYGYIPGKGYLAYDLKFTAYRRVSEQTASSGGGR